MVGKVAGAVISRACGVVYDERFDDIVGAGDVFHECLLLVL